MLASLAMDELRSLWRAEEISYVSESPADPETNPRIRRPHRVSYRITIGVVPAGLPEGSAHARYAFEVVEFGD